MSSNKKWHLATASFACFAVATDDNGIIVESAPIGKKFMGQPLVNLENWVKNRDQNRGSSEGDSGRKPSTSD